ncbi:hypothetical protein N8D56_19255 [Devosia sp. A8/3-2]|nr:hypothetical protein N8D56_19255 [Devosia sp. A8/3-2]
MLFPAMQVPIMLVLALFFANALNDSKLWGRGFFRTAIFLPCVTSLVAYSVIFKSIFAIDGIANQTLLVLHLIENPINWLSDPFWARVVVITAITGAGPATT